MNEIENIKEELRKYLYNGNEEKKEIDKINFRKTLYKLLRECIKTKNYEVKIGTYFININPQELSVRYETSNTTVIISNNDVYYDTDRDTEINYFIITNEEKTSYPGDIGALQVSGLISNTNGEPTEFYTIELSSLVNNNINNYINIPNDFTIDEEFMTDHSITVKRNIKNISDTRFDIINFFNKDQIKRAIYDYQTDTYYIPKDYKRDTYNMYLPALDEYKNITSYIYSLIVEFYTEYINK